MKEHILIKRYAEAYVSYVRDTNEVEKAVGEFKALKWIISQNPEFLDFLTNPEIMYHEKYDFVEKVLDAHFSVDLRNFVKLLIEKRRIILLPEIADYIRKNYAHAGATDAILKTAYPLDLDVISLIKTRFEQKMKHALNLYLDLDPDLKGGIQVIIGNTIFDGSVRTQLSQLRGQLQKAQM